MLKINKLTCIMALVLTVGCHDAFSIPAPKSLNKAPEGMVSDAASFKAALKTAVPGSEIVWADGEYEGVVLKMIAEGTSEAPIILRAQTPGKVVFKGVSSITLQGSWLVAEGFCFTGLDTSVKGSVLTFAKGSSNCHISNCKIDGKSSRASDVDTKWVSMYGTRNEISHCTFLEKKNMGCLLVVWMEDGVVPEHRIADNYFYRPYTNYDDNGKARNGQESIRIGTSDFSMSKAACTVSGNHLYRCHGERAEIISNKSCFNVYTGNLFEESDGSLTLRHGNDCVVRGNYFLSGGKSDVGGVRIIGERHVVEDNYFMNLTGTNYKAALCVVKGESAAELNGYWTVKDCLGQPVTHPLTNEWSCDAQARALKTLTLFATGSPVEFTFQDPPPEPPSRMNCVIDMEGDMIRKVEFIGGCPGNTQGVARLSENRPIDEVISIVDGIQCGPKPTSCPDQLAQALKQIKAEAGL